MIQNLFQNPILLAAASAAWLPFLSFAVIMIMTRPYPRFSSALSLAAVTLSFLNALYLILHHGSPNHPIHFTARWLVSGSTSIHFGLLLDPTSLLMLLIVAGISFLVQVYSLGYMWGDPGFSRYYAFQSLFAGSMMSLVLSSSLIQLYFFWELVGLCSYLLIGFWIQKFSATEAGKKAFVMTRLGDVAFFLGLLVVLLNLGNVNILEMNGPEVTNHLSSGWITLSALLIFGGIVGKSAQFPLLTWLPDAMEGPTPVSALLHSATMVAAGIFLFARLFPFFSHSQSAMTVFLAIGTLTMLMASTMALVDRDIKKIWAYSTISQFGFMIMALAAGGYFAGLFHLTTHAVFKSLLFLCSGVWIHYYQTNDLYEIGRKSGRRLKIPLTCFILAGASLSGLPLFSGFFSKEAILASLFHLNNPIWLAAGLLGVFLTPYYTFRPIFIILFPRQKDQEPSGEGRNGASLYWVMTLPLIILTGVILILGFWEPRLKTFLMGQPPVEEVNVWLAPLSTAFVLLALALAWMDFGRKDSRQIGFAERNAGLRNFLSERWYLDHFYRFFLKLVIYRIFADGFTRNERQVIDKGIDGFGYFTWSSGRVASYLQSGRLRYNIFVSFVVLGLVALYFFFV
jgi:NADH-quinone oxidoreductase subunit L